MANKKRNPKPVISSSLSEASGQIVLDALDAGFEIDDFTLNSDKKSSRQIRGEQKFNQEGLDEIVNISSNGAPIAGQSLTNDPDQAYPWEKPAVFANPREALDSIVTELLQPEPMKNIVNALANGAAVADLAVAVLYAKFNTGDINPDIMLLLVEPVNAMAEVPSKLVLVIYFISSGSSDTSRTNTKSPSAAAASSSV